MALSANTLLNYSLGDVNQFPVAASQTIYEGSAVGLTSGYARALNAGDPFVGFSMGKVIEATAANGGANVQVASRGDVQLTITSVAVTDVGKPVYASADGTFTLTQGSNSYIGKVLRYITTNTALVRFESTPAGETANKIWTVLSIPVALATIADGDVVTTLTPGFAGKIEKWAYVADVIATTAAKTTALNMEIGTTNLTGGVLTITTAAAGTKGVVTAATAITAGNTFGATDTISVEAASTTTFVEGSGALLIWLSQEVKA